jgi:hypothetical protein
MPQYNNRGNINTCIKSGFLITTFYISSNNDNSLTMRTILSLSKHYCNLEYNFSNNDNNSINSDKNQYMDSL